MRWIHINNPQKKIFIFYLFLFAYDLKTIEKLKFVYF